MTLSLEHSALSRDQGALGWLGGNSVSSEFCNFGQRAGPCGIPAPSSAPSSTPHRCFSGVLLADTGVGFVLLEEQGARWALECLRASQPQSLCSTLCMPGLEPSPASLWALLHSHVSAFPTSAHLLSCVAPAGSSPFPHPSHSRRHSLSAGIAGSSSSPLDDAAESFCQLQLLPPPANPHPEGVRGPGAYLELPLTSRSSDLG